MNFEIKNTKALTNQKFRLYYSQPAIMLPTMITHHTPSTTKRNQNLQLLRGISVILVILFHLNQTHFWFGYMGVDVFFFVSGYLLIPKILEAIQAPHAKTNIILFFRKRLRRILPPFYIMLALCIPIVFLLGYPSQHLDIFKLSQSSLLGVANYGAYLFTGDYFEPRINPFLHLWSLSAEEQCYLLSPIALYFLYLVSRKKIPFTVLPHTLTLLLLIIHLSLSSKPEFYDLIGIHNGTSFSYYSTIPRLIEFFLGGLFAISKTRIQNFIALCSIILLVVSLFVEKNSTTIGMVIGLCIFAVNFKLRDKTFTSLISKVLSWVGDRSYSIYLYHLPIIYICGIHLSNSFQYIVGTLLSFFCGHLSYQLIEKRYCFERSHQRFPSKKLVVSILLTLTFCIFITNQKYLGLVEKLDKVTYDGTGGNFKFSFMNQKCSSLSPCELVSNDLHKGLIVLVGDSRAEMYSRVFYELAIESRVNLAIWSTPGCRIVLEDSVRNSSVKSCLERNEELLEYLKVAKPNKIVVSQAVYADSDLRSMQRALKKISDSASKVYVIGEIPLFPDDETFLVKRPIISIKRDYPKRLSEDRLNRAHLHAANLYIASASKLGFRVIQPKFEFCKNGYCSRHENGNWLYSDISHLSSEGAQKMKKVFDKNIFSS